MAKQLNVSLAFTANTSQAKAQIQDLQRTLDTLVKGSAAGAAQNGLPLTKDLMEAQIAATKLGTILSQSLNTQTGNLDLTKFSDSLNKSGMKLEVLKGQLESLGPTGQKAFMSLASSIVSADVPLTRTNKLVSELWTTMKNTARWQLSSSMLHSFMGTIQSAVGYAQDLNESLNNIRIVTSQSTEQMAAFAERANKAAKALSATTTEYTNASLIYYQQGLSDQEVQDRADITIKMAHASGQSAEIVSDQLTAVWNNFYDGSKSLEHYADVMTALGAATASSSDEIAGGLEKFASIADMIGLSYEYAASALATITAQTRQSEEVVGTALKTIFARIQGLNLGETLDDGTTMNKYSEALNKVGISIKDQNGELKDMDAILNEMGAKWETLSKDQQTALAQTVAGVRQYNQLVSLMDNWDFFQDNLSIANNSSGALQEQADIYAESWEAARDRVTAAAEDIYDSILDDKFFITVLNGFEKLLTGVGEFADSLNGLPGVLSVLGVIVTKVFSNQLAESVERIAFNLRSLSGQTQKAAEDLRNIAMQEASNIGFNTGTAAGDLQGEQLKRRLELQNQIREVSKNMSADQKEQLASLLQINDAYAQQAILAAEAQDKASDKAQDSRSNIRTSMRKGGASEQETSSGLANITKEMNQINSVGLTAVDAINKIDQTFENTATSTAAFDKELDDVIKGLQAVGRNTAARSVDALRKKFNANGMSAQEFKKALLETVNAQDLMDDTALAAAGKLSELQRKYHLTDAECEEYANDLLRLAQATRTADNANDAYAESYNKLQQSINGFQGAMNNFGTSVVKGVQGISQMAMGINALVAAWDTLNNEDMSFGEKLLSVTMSLTMAIPALIGGYQALKEAKLGEAFASMKAAAAEMIDAASKATATGATTTATVASGSLTFSLLAQAAAWVALQLSISPLLALLLVIVGAIASVTLVAWGLVKVFQAIKAASPEGQLKALQEQADKSAEAFNRVQEAVNATKQAIESLDSSYETIENLTKGTNEWYEAVTNVNAEVLKLLEQYPDLLAGHIFTTEDGILGIDEEGRNKVATENRMRLQAAQNVNTSNQIAVKEKEIDNSLLNFNDPNGIISGSYDYYGAIASAMQSYYENENVGEQLFTREGSDALLKGLKEVVPSLFQDDYGNERYIDPQAFYETVMANESIIRENATKRDQVGIMEDALIQSRGIATGSNRSADEIRSIMGENTYNDIKAGKLADVKSAFGDWNNHINYKEGGAYTTDKEWGMIEDFMKLQGDDVEYVAQRNGKMVLEVDGEEIEYSKDEVYDALAELYTGPDWEANFEKGLEESLKQSLGKSVEHLNLEDLTAIDNFRTDLAKSLTGTEFEGQSENIFSSVMNQYGTSQEGVNAFQQDTQYIDLTSEAFLRQAIALNEGAINAEQFASAVGELNAQGQLMALGDYFATVAESMDLDEEAAQDMQDYAEHLRSIAKDSEMLADSLAEDADSSADLAVEITRMNKGINDLADGFSDWKDILKKSSKESAEYAKAMKQTKSALADVMDVEENLISNNFVENHLEEISKAAEGDAEAIDFLRSQMDEEIIANITLGQADEFIAKIQAIDEEIKNNIPENIEVGAIINDGAFYEAAAKMVEEAGMTADEANAYFAGMGYEPVYNTEEIDNSAEVPNALTRTSVESIGWEEADVDLGLFGTHQIKLPAVTTRTESIPEDPSTASGVTRLTSFSGDGKAPPIAGLRKKATGSQNNYSKQNSGGQGPGKKSGGGSKGSKPKKVNKDDIVDRYKEINDQLDNVKDAYEDASKEADRLYGASRISAMKRANNEIQKEIGLLEKKKEEAQKYLKLDKEALELAAKQAGVQLEFQDNEIINYTAVLEQLYNQLKALIDAAGETVDETEQEAIDKLQEKIDELKSAIKAFDDTKELIEDTDNDIKDKFYEWQDNNYEELSYKLELEIDINDAELQKLEYFLNKYSDNFYKMAESAALMNDKIDPTIQNLEEYKNHKEALDESYRNGEISQEAYIEGLKEVREGYYNNLEALIELDKQMEHYLEDTLSAADGEVADFTDHMEHLTGVFDHYMNLMEIFGKQKDYDAMGNFLSGKADTLRDRLDVAKEYYKMLKENSKVDEYWSNYQSALAAGDEDEAKWWKNQWDAEVDALDAAQEKMLGLTEEWAESMKAVVENNMAKAADALEKSLTNGFGFDFLLDQWDRINTQQEEYLDKTNQIYETNKMMRTAQKALDETTNKIAKQKLKNFIEETARLQENTKLSKHELEIRQAQYDLLLAEIALEEAQNAKSTVRLSRDSEGNFGYIYTADEDKVNEAEQNLDDKRNNIYNLSLEGQKEYTDKYLQASKEMSDELNELQAQYLEGLLTEEEFKLRSEAIKKYYLGSSEFQKAMADLEEEYRKGNLGSEEEYNRLRQEIIRKYSAQDIGILNQYLDIANTSNRIAREEDAKLQQKYQDENIISQEEYYKKKAEMIKSFNENMATLDKAYYEDGALTEAEYNQLRENLTNKFHNDMKELNNTYYQDGIENENKFNQEKEALTNKYHSDLKALNDAFYIDGTISEEEYNNERNALTKKYHDDINALTKDYYKTGLEDDKNYNKEKAELIDTFANDSKGVLGDFFDFYLDKTESTGDNASESWGDNLGNMAHSTSDWSDDVNDYLDEVEEGAEDMRDVYEEVNEDLEDALENSAEVTEDLKDESDDLRKEIKNKVIPAIKDEIDEVKKLTTKYGLQKEELDKLIDTYEDYLDLIGEKIEYHSIETEEPEIQIPKEEQTETPSAEEKPVNNSEAKKIAKEAQEIINKVHYGKDGMTEGNNGWAPNARKKGYSEEAIAIAKKAFNDSKDGSGYSYFYEEALKLAGQYNTGGYTGAWGPEGKLAFLHEKELILNKDDTENILNTVSFIRDIVSMIDNKANMSSLFSMSAMAGITSGNMGMEQQVTIYAEFPDATDHNEIEQAFNSLLNTASQYANRK